MIITRTPFRVSFVGGGSDVPWYYRDNGYGMVLSAAITQYMYIVIHPYFHGNRIRLKYSETEDITEIGQIKHKIIKVCLEKFKLSGGIEIASFADVPAGSGLGSSSAFTVGLLHALYAWQGKTVSKECLAEEACEIEIDILKKPIGKQDQYASAFGGLNLFRFNRDETVTRTPVLISSEATDKLCKHLRLYYTEGSRSADNILLKQNSENNRQDKTLQIQKLVALVEKLRGEIEIGNIKCLGNTLHNAWQIKREISSGITNERIEEIYSKALSYGAVGGKLLGAGESGFMLFYCNEHDKLEKNLNLQTLPFFIDNDGSKLIYYETV